MPASTLGDLRRLALPAVLLALPALLGADACGDHVPIGSVDAGADGGCRAETCNGIDDDCNGLVDDGASLCPAGQSCTMGVCTGTCAGTAETCNGIDDDCNGLVDDGASLCPAGQTCSLGACTACTTCGGA